MKLSKKSLDVLSQLFSEQSNLQLPAGVAEQVMEIRVFINDELNKIKDDGTASSSN